MYEKKMRFKSRIEEMIDDIKPYSYKKKCDIDKWKFSCADSDYPPVSNWINVDIGYEWNPNKFPVWFESTFMVDSLAQGESAYLEMWFGGESLVFIDGSTFGEINPYHKSIDISDFCDEKKHTVDVQAVPKFLFGHQNRTPKLEKARIDIMDTQMVKIINSFKMALEVFHHSDDEVFCSRLAKIIENALCMVKIPKDTESYSKIVQDHQRMWNHVYRKWESEHVPYVKERCLGEEHRNTLVRAYESLNSGLEELKERFSGKTEISLCGHAHIDYAWLWPIKETRRKTARTFSNVIRMMEKYPDFIYTQSSAQMYLDIKEKYPGLYANIRQKISEGKWEVTGGMWVESDCNVPAAESLIRQFLTAQTFFRKEFGFTNRVCWLPDVFGFSWILPQICKESGVDYFLTTKLTWNEKNSMPHDTFRWRGLDGSEVIYNSFDNPNGYNGIIEPETVIENMKRYKDREFSDMGMMSFGYGDGGGGPSDEMLDNFEIIKDYPGMPKLKMRKAVDHFRMISEKYFDELPVWDDELYFEFHRGTLTSQARTKKLHKDCEDAIFLTEMASTLIGGEKDYPGEKIEKLWHKILRNEFHDILPGSSIKEVYEDSENELSEVIDSCKEITASKFEKVILNDIQMVTVLNSSYIERSICFETDGESNFDLTTPSGCVLLSQKTHDGKTIYISEEKIKPFSVTYLKKQLKNNNGNVQEDFPIDCDSKKMENEYLSVSINDDGTLMIFDKQNEKEIFKSGSNMLLICEDVPTNWDAWDIDHNHEKYATQLKADNIETIESGPVRKIIRVTYHYEKSTVVQEYILSKFSQKLDISTKIDWHHRRKLLKTKFYINALSRKARFDLSAGFIERPTTRNTSWEEAKFEVPTHRWADLSQSDFGVGILNDGKYGYGCEQNRMTVTLLKSAVNPSLFADEGKHEFSYSIYPHDSFSAVKLCGQAEILNKRLILINGKLDIHPDFIKIDSPNIKPLCIKQSENGGVVLRMAEISGATKKVRVGLNFGRNFSQVWKTDMLENKKEMLLLENGETEVLFEPFKIITLLFI